MCIQPCPYLGKVVKVETLFLIYLGSSKKYQINKKGKYISEETIHIENSGEKNSCNNK